MTPSKPYVVRAIYDWIVDNNCTPHVLVDAGVEGVVVPVDYVNEGQIVLNISPTAVVTTPGKRCHRFQWSLWWCANGSLPPPGQCVGIYARENGQGMIFDDENEPDDRTPPEPDPITPGPGNKPSLKLVK